MANKTRTLGPGSLKIGESGTQQDFSADVTNVTLTPDTSTDDTINYLDGSSEAGAQTTSWTLEGNIKEDYSMTGVQVWCLQNAGKSVPFEFVPSNTGGLKLTGNLTVSPVGFGGDVKAKNDISFSFACDNVEPQANPAG